MTENTVYLLSVAIGQILPYFTDFINKFVPNSKFRFLVSLLVSGAIGTALSYQSLKFDTIDSVILAILSVWASSQAAYKLYYEDSKMQTTIRYTKPLKII